MLTTVCIGLGANLGDRERALKQALTALQSYALPGSWKASSLYETVPVGGSGPDYLNAVCSFSVDLPAQDLHRILLELERNAGRLREALNAPRTLDLDLLFYGSEMISTPALTVPHPRTHQRAFVLIPLTEIAPEWVHPVFQKTIRKLAEELSPAALQGVKKYDTDSFCETISS